MRNLIIFMLLVGVFVLVKRSCHFSFLGVRGEGPLKTETRSLSGFHAVALDLSGDVEISVSDTYLVNCGTISETLKAKVSGSGDVFYSRSPTVESKVSGSGSVEKK